ncbi:TonB-dependent receptor [Kordiimonas gwangyangensis]|uniref:TonB-dependent receptor n=1 Tax=Kordiimonas gwangyangensis TaxID=288022 RepID=UPI000363EB42|nr:TonB-dependent receptor [Kordiimonas gwangyangensis]
MKPGTRNAIVAFTALGTILPAPIASFAADESGETIMLEEIVVTSRRRAENLQSVPDSVTAFGAQTIERAGIDDVQDFVDLTPNITMRETFRAGVTFITIRGITTGQQGWAPVTYVVDGVQAGSLDAINQGALTDIERIEVLKGPQGALYGAGAIAGAINIVTKKPTNEMEYKAQASYGSGNDIKLSGVVSGPIVEDRVLFRLGAYYRNTDGVIESTDGDGLDYEEQISLKGRLLFDFDNLTLDVRGAYSDVTAGAAAQEVVGSASLIDDFNTPGPARGVRGEENREFKEFSAKLDWDTGVGTFTSVTGYSDIEQDLFGSASWQKGPGVGLFGPFGGDADAFNDFFQDLADNFETFTQDVRFTSNADQPVRWLVGLSYMDRKVENLLSVGGLLQGLEKVEADMVRLLYRPDVRNDEIWGGYGQVSVDVTDKLELTGALRYDTNSYDTTQYTDLTYSTPVPTPDGIVTQTAKNSRWQPKVQLSYDWSDDVMTYITYAEGFRFGFFNTGNLTAPENTKNFELGFKTTLADGRVRMNGALFHIDYSDQQFTSVIGEAPFRLTTNVPEANINGGELEISALLTEELEFSGGLGITDAKIKGGQRSAGTPDYSVNLSLTYTRELGNGWDLISRADYRRQGTMVLWDGAGGVFEVGEKDFVNVRLKVRNDNWFVGVFADNLTNEQQANDFGFVGFGYLRANSMPRVLGIEAGFSF